MLLALGEVDLGGGQQAASGHSPLGCASHSFNKTREGNLQQLDDGEEHDTTLVFISPPPLFLSLSLSLPPLLPVSPLVFSFFVSPDSLFDWLIFCCWLHSSSFSILGLMSWRRYAET